ncbi:MAG: hypothetical protein ACXWZB_01155 [Gaiellaceae bacterium]
MTIWRRRRSPPPVLLPSLDRLAGLIERVVELVDAVTVPPAPVSEPDPEPPRELDHVMQPSPETPSPETPSPETPGPEQPRAEPAGWVAFVPSPAGYRLVARSGPPPAGGERVELEEERYVVLRLAPSPLPADRRRCAFLSRQEPPREERSPDA